MIRKKRTVNASPVVKRVILPVLRYTGQGILAAHVFIFFWILVASVYLNFFNPPTTALKWYRHRTARYPVKKSQYIPLNKIPRDFQRMVRQLEDTHFYYHPGIDPYYMKEAWRINRRLRKKAVGASTITQQLARTLFLNPRKSYIRKYVEILIAVEMDLIIPKNRILELYFNNAEWGKGIFGVETAAHYYYDKSVPQLSLEEKMRLATVLSSPLKYTPHDFGKKAILHQRYDFLRTHYGTNEGVLSNQISPDLIAPEDVPPVEESDETIGEEETDDITGGQETSSDLPVSGDTNLMDEESL